jgi:hypothetical protein
VYIYGHYSGYVARNRNLEEKKSCPVHYLADEIKNRVSLSFPRAIFVIFIGMDLP